MSSCNHTLLSVDRLESEEFSILSVVVFLLRVFYAEQACVHIILEFAHFREQSCIGVALYVLSRFANGNYQYDLDCKVS
jgi:hypothetical protein